MCIPQAPSGCLAAKFLTKHTGPGGLADWTRPPGPAGVMKRLGNLLAAPAGGHQGPQRLVEADGLHQLFEG